MVWKVFTGLLLMGVYSWGAQLTPAVRQSFDQYAAGVEARLAQQHNAAGRHLAILDRDPTRRSELQKQLEAGDIVVEQVGGGMRELPGALQHHWRAAALVPGGTPGQMLALLRDYMHLTDRYAPKIDSARALKDNGETALLAVRMREQRVITLVLDAEYQVETHLAGDHGYSASRSIHIWQVEDAGTPHEHRLPEGDDDGALWRLNSYWSFERAPGGLLIECEAVSLTRDIPAGLGWLIAPVVQSLPSDSLQFSLKATRNALTAIAARKAMK